MVEEATQAREDIHSQVEGATHNLDTAKDNQGWVCRHQNLLERDYHMEQLPLEVPQDRLDLACHSQVEVILRPQGFPCLLPQGQVSQPTSKIWDMDLPPDQVSVLPDIQQQALVPVILDLVPDLDILLPATQQVDLSRERQEATPSQVVLQDTLRQEELVLVTQANQVAPQVMGVRHQVSPHRRDMEAMVSQVMLHRLPLEVWPMLQMSLRAIMSQRWDQVGLIQDTKLGRILHLNQPLTLMLRMMQKY